jgi:hypothetical protein
MELGRGPTRAFVIKKMTKIDKEDLELMLIAV